MARYDFIKLNMSIEWFQELIAAIDDNTSFNQKCIDNLENTDNVEIDICKDYIHRNNEIKEKLINHCKEYCEKNEIVSVFKNELIELIWILLENSVMSREDYEDYTEELVKHNETLKQYNEDLVKYAKTLAEFRKFIKTTNENEQYLISVIEQYKEKYGELPVEEE